MLKIKKEKMQRKNAVLRKEVKVFIEKEKLNEIGFIFSSHMCTMKRIHSQNIYTVSWLFILSLSHFLS